MARSHLSVTAVRRFRQARYRLGDWFVRASRHPKGVVRAPFEALRRGRAWLRWRKLPEDDEARARSAQLRFRRDHARAAPSPSVTVVAPVTRPANLARCVAHFAAQSYANKELLLVLNNARFDPALVRRALAGVEQVSVLQLPGRPTLGDCLNQAVAKASGAFIAKMDDDDWYGDAYLADLMLAACVAGAEIAGKGAYYAWLEGRGIMALRQLAPEGAWVRRVAGATLLARRDVLTRIPFRPLSLGEDRYFFQDARLAGCRIYSADRFNFLVFRRQRKASHAWRIGDDEFLEICQHCQPRLALARATL